MAKFNHHVEIDGMQVIDYVFEVVQTENHKIDCSYTKYDHEGNILERTSWITEPINGISMARILNGVSSEAITDNFNKEVQGR